MEIIMPDDNIAWVRSLQRKMLSDIRHSDMVCRLMGVLALLVCVWAVSVFLSSRG